MAGEVNIPGVGEVVQDGGGGLEAVEDLPVRPGAPLVAHVDEVVVETREQSPRAQRQAAPVSDARVGGLVIT